MKNIKKSSKTAKISLLVIIIGLVVVAGWLFLNQQNNNDTAKNESQAEAGNDEKQSTDDTKTDEETISENVGYQPEIPSGWVKKVDTTVNAQYAVPVNWGDEVKIQKFAVDENIPVGFGSPVWVRFSSSSKTWQTIDIDNNGNPTIVRMDNIVSTSNVNVENQYPTSTYATGDGDEAQFRIVVVKDSQVLQFLLPTTCDGEICGGQRAWTFEDVRSLIPQFIKTITISQ